MSQREHLEFDGAIESDCAPLHSLVAAMLETSEEICCLRDPVRGACEILGFDPLYVANEGKLIAIVGADSAAAVLTKMRLHALGRDAQIIGEVTDQHPRMVVMRTGIGGSRVVDMLFGEQLPRIC